MGTSKDLSSDASIIHEQLVRPLFQLLESICEGAVVVDREARIEWISEKYPTLLGLDSTERALGKPIEELIPTSLMRFNA